ncbi:SDR family NAD(P)-dependent oxidoreductase [Thermodesulfobacteriota bacterium]
MLKILKDEVAIITGAGRGIGKAFALRFAQEGAKLLLPDISLERAEAVAEGIRGRGGEAATMEIDIASESATKLMAEKVIEEYGRVDILVNNAAMYHGLQRRPWDTRTAEEWESLLAVNVTGTYLCCKAIAPHMIKQSRGKIINIASGIIKSPGGHTMLHYACSKAAVKTMTELLARALGRSGITINAIAPGYTATEASFKLGDAEGSFERAVASQCIPRRQEAEDLVGAAVFLASRDSDFITGQTISVDGGNWMP